MGDKESKSAWRCPTCGAWHEREGYHEMTIADQVPTQNEYEKEDNACPSACSFWFCDDDGGFCVLGLHEKPQIDIECSPGPGCPINKGKSEGAETSGRKEK